MKAIRYYLAEDTIDRKDIDSLIRWLKTYPRLTKGKLNLKFEERWNRWLGRKYSASCNSGSSANLLMYDALRMSGRLKNMKVIVPSVGWATSIAPAIQLGFTPIMCEADSDTFGLDLNHLESLLKKHRPATVLLVHVLGVPHKMKEMLALKKKYGFYLLEDACAAVGATYGGKKIGAFGDMASFSFYFGHQMSTIEGGMVSTDDPGLRDMTLMLRSHGWSKDLDRKTHAALVRKHKVDDFHSPFVFYIPGYNLRSTDLNAQIGLGQIAKLDRMTAARQKNHELYRRLLGGALRVQRVPQGATAASISFGLLAADATTRRRIVDALVKKGVETRIFSAGNLGQHPFWYERYGRGSFPFADRIHHTGFFLPNNPSLGRSEIEFISRIVLGAL